MDERTRHLEVQRALADHLLADRWAPALAHLVLLGLVMPLVWGLVPSGALLAGAAAIAALAVARVVLCFWLRSRPQPPAAVALAARSTLTGLGLAWGVGFALTAPRLPFTTVAVMVMGLARSEEHTSELT